MRQFHATRVRREEFQKGLRQQASATQLKTNVLQLRAHFAQCGGILPKPNESTFNTWVSIPNKVIVARSFNINIVAPPTPIVQPMDSCEELDPNLEALLRSITSDPHNFVVYRDPHIEASSLPISGATNHPLSDGHKAVNALDKQAPPCNTSSGLYPSSLAGSIVSPLISPTPSPSVGYSSLSRTNSQNSNSLGDTAALRQAHGQMVLESMTILITQGHESLASILLERGVSDYKSAIPVTMVVHTLQKDLSSKMPNTGKDLAYHLRFCALSMFQEYWKAPLAWNFSNELSKEHTRLVIRAVNMAGFIGSLFTVGIVTADDIHRCLECLIDGTVKFDHVCAMHALIVQANDKLCKSKSAPFIQQFRNILSTHFLKTNLVICEESKPSRFLVENIVATIDQWFATHSLKRYRSLPSTSRHAQDGKQKCRSRPRGWK